MDVENNEEKIKNLTAWLMHQTKETPFGEVGLLLTIHAGKIKRVSKTIMEKEQ